MRLDKTAMRTTSRQCPKFPLRCLWRGFLHVNGPQAKLVIYFVCPFAASLITALLIGGSY